MIKSNLYDYSESKGKYDNRNIRLKMSMIRSNLYYYSDAYILVEGTTRFPYMVAAGAAVNNTNKRQYLKIVLHLLIA